VNTSRTPEEDAHSPSWPNGLFISIVIIIVIIIIIIVIIIIIIIIIAFIIIIIIIIIIIVIIIIIIIIILIIMIMIMNQSSTKPPRKEKMTWPDATWSMAKKTPRWAAGGSVPSRPLPQRVRFVIVTFIHSFIHSFIHACGHDESVCDTFDDRLTYG
jgi:amino acid transporter